MVLKAKYDIIQESESTQEMWRRENADRNAAFNIGYRVLDIFPK